MDAIRLRRGPWWLFGALLLLLTVPPGLAPADDAEGEEASEEEPLSAQEARRLEKLLSSAARKREAADILPLLAEVGERSHPSFQKPLLKLLDHDSAEVCLKAADMLAAQKPGNEKDAEKLAKAIWKEGFASRANSRRFLVQGRSLVAAATQLGRPLDKREFSDVERLWRTLTGDPDPAQAGALIDICRYVRITKDKRLCRLLAEEIDEPVADAPNSPTNPPASWWEKRWNVWKSARAPAVEALEDLTGQSFKSTAAAKEWFEANVKEFGFEW